MIYHHMICQLANCVPTRGMDISTHVDFVYPEHPGEDVFVYLIDLGIQIKVINVSLSPTALHR